MSHTLLQAGGLCLNLGGRDLLADVSLSLHAGTRTALLGRNGSGKTTLLRLLAGLPIGEHSQPAEGAVWRRPGLRLAYLGQHHHFAAGVTVAQALAAADPYRALHAEAEALAAQLDQPAALARWSEVQDTLQRRKAAAWPARLGRILAELGLAELGLGGIGGGEWAMREAATLSGGERTRLALALTLAREPDLLLLDEPTNHLDIRMREWLEGWLRATFHAGGSGAVLLTSHDRDFLDAVAGRSLWLAGGELREYAGGYTRATEQRALERRTLRRAARLGDAERGRLGQSAGRLNVWGTSARAVQSRRRRIAAPEAPAAERQLRMRLLAGDARAELLAWGQHLSVSYGGRAVLRRVRFRLRRGDRVALLGANGTGKSTLLRLLAGELRADAGLPAPELPAPELHFAAGASVAYLDQTWHGLTPQQTLLAQFRARFGDRAPALLGQAGFGASDWERRPGTLSGGERARAGLALVSGLRADILLLDEPTNHLDVQALASLEGAVQAYGGALIMVTHDRRLARTVATRLWLLEGGELREVDRWNGSHYTDPARVLDVDPPPEPPAPTPLERLEALEDEVLALQARLDTAQAGRVPLTGREEARVFAALHALEPQLWQAYAEAFAAPVFDAQVPEPVEGLGRVWVRGLHLGEEGTGGVFWATAPFSATAKAEAASASPFDGPHLAWDGETLRSLPCPPASPALARALLGGALRILFERWNIGCVRLGTGPTLRRREWFERVGLARR